MASREFRLPDLGEGLEDAEVVRWLVEQGQDVALNQPLVEVDTAKALVEIPSPFAGKVWLLHAHEGEVVKVGSALVTFEVGEDHPAPGDTGGRTAVLVGYGAQQESTATRRRRLKAGKAGVSDGKEGAEPAKSPGRKAAVLAAPPVRKLAAELGVELGTVTGSGPGGRITREDVEAAGGGAAAERAEATPVVQADVEKVPVRGARRLIARKMSQSATRIPHVTTFISFDATATQTEAKRLSKSRKGKLSPLAIVSRAFVEICKRYPELNASFDETSEQIFLYKQVHLGIATDTDRGLLVPVVRDAGDLGTADLAKEIEAVTSKARDGKASPDQLTGSTVTVSNVGSFGAEFGTPIINFPEACILALGLVSERPWVVDGEIAVRPVGVLSLSFDHRLLDGARAGRAMVDLKALLEDEALAAKLR